MNDLTATRIGLTAIGMAQGHTIDDAMDTALYVSSAPSAKYAAFDELVHEFLKELEAE